MQDRLTFLELAKIAKSRGTLTPTLLRIYLKAMIRQKRKEDAEASPKSDLTHYSTGGDYIASF